jgi:hypothetical protein
MCILSVKMRFSLKLWKHCMTQIMETRHLRKVEHEERVEMQKTFCSSSNRVLLLVMGMENWFYCSSVTWHSILWSEQQSGCKVLLPVMLGTTFCHLALPFLWRFSIFAWVLVKVSPCSHSDVKLWRLNKILQL